MTTGARPVLSWAAALVVVAVAHTAVSLDAVAPVQTKDEIGYLAGARWIATGEGASLLTPDYAGGYAVGWGLLTAPLWWLTAHPPTVYGLSIAVGVLVSVLVVVPAAAVARRLGVGPRRSLLLATALSLGAGRLGYTGYALPEGLLTLQLVTVTWLLLRLGEGEPRSRCATPLALGVLLAWLPTTHARFAPLALLGLLVLLRWSWRARSAVGAVAVAVGVVGAVAGWWLNGHVEQVLYGDVARTAVAAQQATSLRPGDVLALAVGHAWYAAVAWLGLTVLGWCALLGASRTELARRSPGTATWLLLGSLVQLGVGAAYLSTRLGVGARVDQLVYGRYGDPLWFVLALVGGAALLTRRSPSRLVAAAAAVTVTLSAGTLVVLATTGERAAGFVQLNVPGIEAWAWTADGRFVVPWAPATATAVAFLVAVLLALLATSGLGTRVARSRPGTDGPGDLVRTGAVVVAGVVLLGLAVVAEQRNIQPRDLWIRQMFALRGTVEQALAAAPADASRPPVLLVEDPPLLLSGNALQWWLADLDPAVLRLGEATGQGQFGAGAQVPDRTPDGALVVGPVAAPPAAPPPAAPGTLRLLGVEPSGSYAVWQLDR